VLAEHFTRERGLPDVGEKVPKSEDVADFVGEGIHLLFPTLSKHLGIDHQFVSALVGKEGARQDAPVNVTIIDLPHHNLEVKRYEDHFREPK
jgi:hypothetical protein